MELRGEIAQAIAAALLAKINRPPNAGMVTHLTDALMPLVRKAQAEALRDAAEADDFFARYVDGEGHDFNRGVTHGANSLFDQLRARADRIEQNGEGNET